MFAFHATTHSFHRRLSAVAGAFLLLAGLLPASLVAPTAVRAASSDIVISQVYGGGGNSGATLTNDFIELFNRGTSPVSVTGWSVQYASATGTGSFSSSVTVLSGTIQPGQYFLVQEAAGAGGTAALPTPDVLGSITMSGTSGKVIVANTATGLACNGGSTPCSSAQLAQIVDLVGYGGANFFEGSAAAPGLVNTTADFRADGGCTDTDDNAADFAAAAPDPRNSASPTHACTSTPASPVINEFSASTTGTDVEYVEVFADASTDLSNLAILEIEGDSSSATGTVDEVIPVGTTDAGGFWLGDLAANSLENGTITLLLVDGFTGALGDDLDTNDDGTFDTTPWTDVVDAVAVNDGGSGDLTYGIPVLGPNYDGVSSFAPGGASRIPDGLDTDATSDWVRNDFDLAGISGFTGTISAGEAYNTPGATNEAYVPPVTGECGDAATYIHDVQGSGATSPLVGSSVVIEGVVVGDFQNNGQPDSGELDGFYVQEEDADADADAATSEGIFVFAPSADDVAVGDLVRVAGTVSEFGSGGPQTELSGVAGVLVCDSGVALPAATSVTLPFTTLDEAERYEGMLVTFPQALSITEYFNFDRFNEVVLTSERQYQPTAVAEPGSAEAAAIAEANALDRITLDDGRTNQNPDPLIHPDGDIFTLNHRFRGGDTVTGVTGVIDHSFGLYRIQPVADADYTSVNPRPAEPEDVGGSLHVASFNVLNYFTTLDDGTNDICGPAGDQECRGADDAEELARQRAKIVAALSEINADVVGLIEIENSVGDGPTADLVAGLNDVLGAGTYDYIPTGAIGTDAIRVAIIYKPASVSPLGSYAILDSSVDARFDDTRNRPVLAQSFEEVATGGIFTLAVNHLKSKGSDCGGAPDDDPQQGNCNGTRTRAAEALVDWLATDPTGSGDRDALVMGDLNSYDKEDPIDAIREGADDATGTNDDFTDLIYAYQGELAYSYLFDGQLGYLDTALASGTLAPQVAGATIWHINADEPDILDYDTSFKQDAQDALYEANAYRSSDHDPVIVGLDLAAFDFGGLLPPIDGAALNEVKAGRSVPVKFSLGGDFGLDVLYETPQVFDCLEWPSGESMDAQTPGNSMLSYDPSSDQYLFNWKTVKQWVGNCKTLELTFTDGTYVTASFDFVK